jgi:hypothetical protein
MTIVRSMISHLAIPRLGNDGITFVWFGWEVVSWKSPIHPSIYHDKMRKFKSCAKNNCNGKLDRKAHIRKALWGTYWELGEPIGNKVGNTSIKNSTITSHPSPSPVYVQLSHWLHAYSIPWHGCYHLKKIWPPQLIPLLQSTWYLLCWDLKLIRSSVFKKDTKLCLLPKWWLSTRRSLKSGYHP